MAALHRRLGASLRCVWLLLVAISATAVAQERVLPLSVLRSGIEFAGVDVRSMQADDFANPGFLWVDRGARLWSQAVDGVSCEGCHHNAATSMHGVAAHYPAFDKTTGTLMDLEARINDCRVRRQKTKALPRESDDLLSLTAYIANQSRGMPMAVAINADTQGAFDRGRTLYYTRHGQMNISCAQCHEQNFGKRLLVENISQGHPTAFPAYKLEWQTLGSLQRRIRACFFGVRAEMPAPGGQELTDLELFLGWRAQGLPVESPGVRR